MPLHTRDEKLRLGFREVGPFLLASHEIGGLPQIPGTLRLIKDGDVFGWRPRVAQEIVTKMMHVLDECLHALADFALANLKPALPLAGNLITRQCFSQDGYQRTVPRKKDGVGRLIRVASLGRDVEAN